MVKAIGLPATTPGKCRVAWGLRCTMMLRRSMMIEGSGSASAKWRTASAKASSPLLAPGATPLADSLVSGTTAAMATMTA
jgi:hypothetical protein